jgi:hypothetical protein
MNATQLPHEPGSRVSGVCERAVSTPTGKLAVIRRQDTFTLAPLKQAREPLRGQVKGPYRSMAS